MPAKATVHVVANLDKTSSLKDYSSVEVSGWVIIGIGAIDSDRETWFVGKCVNINGKELIETVSNTTTGGTVLVAFSKEVDTLGGRI